MKTLSCTAIVLVAAGSAFAAKSETEGFRMSAIEGFSSPTGGDDRSGFVTPFNVAGIQSWDSPGSAFNTVLFLNVGAGNVVNGLGWDVTLTAFAPSWRNELAVLVTDSTGVGGFFLTPGTDGSSGGPTTYASGGILKLANYGIPGVAALGDGLIRLEFFEYYDDAAGVQDGVWNSGSLFFQTVNEIPAPGAVGLLGLAGVGLLGRKRR